MKDGKSIVESSLKLVVLTNQKKSCGEKIYEMQKMEKVLRALPIKFNHIVMVIDESKDLSEIKLEELQTSFKAHELRLKQRISEKVDEQALHIKFFNKIKEDSLKNKKDKEKQKKKWNKADGAGENSRNQSETSKNGAHDNKKFKNKVEVMEV